MSCHLRLQGSPAAGPPAGPPASFAGLRVGPTPRIGFQWLGWSERSGAPRCRARPYTERRAQPGKLPGVGARAPRAAHLWPPRSETAGGPGGLGLGALGSSAHRPEAHPPRGLGHRPPVPRIPGCRGPASLTSSLPSLNLGGLRRSRLGRGSSIKRLGWRLAPLWPPLGDCQFRPRPSRPAGGPGVAGVPGSPPSLRRTRRNRVTSKFEST